MKLLLIDDDEELCAELEQVLEAEGFKVDIAFDGRQGLEYFQNGEYHVIILDLKLPELNGYNVLKSIRNGTKPIKVLVLSGRPLGDPLLKEEGLYDNEEEKILNMADAVVNKPFVVEKFIQKVKDLALSIVE